MSQPPPLPLQLALPLWSLLEQTPQAYLRALL